MNRIATEQDRQVYGEYIAPGDLIVDTYKFDTSLKTFKFNGYFMGRDWPGLREGGTIWIDGTRLEQIPGAETDKAIAAGLDPVKVPRELIFRNGGKENIPWHIKGVTIRPIPDTQVIATSLTCHGLQDLKLIGTTEKKPGIYALGNKKFLSGNFGFWMKGLAAGGHNYHIHPTDGGKVYVEGIESQGGFSGIRFASGAFDQSATLEMKNFYIHDVIGGEGHYLGRTTAPPYAKLKLQISDGIIARVGAEALQFQHVIGSVCENVTIFAADMAWLHAFQAFQDTGIQWLVNGDMNRIRNVIVDGFCSVALNPFSSADTVPGAEAILENVLFNNGKSIGHYLHKSGSFGVKWIFRNVFYRAFNDMIKETGRAVNSYIVSDAFGSDEYNFELITHDGSKAKVFEHATMYPNIKIGTVVGPVPIPAPEYVNSGFVEESRDIMQWHQYYGEYLPISKGANNTEIKVPTNWPAGRVAYNIFDGKLYKCKVSHVSTSQRPDESPNFNVLTWDENGIRNDQAGHNTSSRQSFTPPDDYRSKEGNFWRTNGIGFLDREDEVSAYYQNGQRIAKTNRGNTYKSQANKQG